MSKPPLGARKDETWYAVSIEPSITKTPIGPVQVPVPYQVISDLSTAMGTASTVQLNGNPAYLLDQSKMPMCTGDEQGSSGGTRSGTTSQEVKPVSGCDSVKFDGKSIIRAGDPCTLNKGNCKGKFIKAPPPSKGPLGSKSARIHIVSSQKVACPDGAIALTAIVTPPSQSLEWSVSDPFEVVNEDGTVVQGGENMVQLQPKKSGPTQTYDVPAPDFSVEISVAAFTANGKAETAIGLPIHRNVAGVKWEDEKKALGEVVVATLRPLTMAAESLERGQLQLILKSTQIATKVIDNRDALKKAAVKFLIDYAPKASPFLQSIDLFARLVYQHYVINSIAQKTQLPGAVIEDDFKMLVDGIGKDEVLFRKAQIVAREMNSFWRKHDPELKAHAITKEDILNVLELLKRLMFGQIAFNLDGDIKGYSQDGTYYQEKPYSFDYGDDRHPLITVPGMHWEYNRAREMQLTCEYSFKSRHSTRIRNYTSNYEQPLFGDTIQSFYSEVAAIDPHAVATAVAISEGIRCRQKVYVVAHSQGTEITRSGLEFIKLMEKIPFWLRKMVFKTTTFQSALQAIVSKEFSDESHRYLRDICALDVPSRLKIDPAKIIRVGDLDAKKRSHIYYQGFGPETYIHKELYDMTYARNARTRKDAVAYLGDCAKDIKIWLKTKYHCETDSQELARLHSEEQWELIDSKAHLDPLCRVVDFEFEAHEWLTNYWPHMHVPTISDKPDKPLERLSQSQTFDTIEKRLFFLTKPSGGVSCQGSARSMANSSAVNKQRERVIAVFIDGNGSGVGFNSNIYRFYTASLANKFHGPDESAAPDEPELHSKYFFGPEIRRDFRGVKAGNDAIERLRKAYNYIVEKYKAHNVGEIPKIDIYGFGRGAAIASELAWKLSADGITGCGDKIKVRFLGLFDMVHCMTIPKAPNGKSTTTQAWHSVQIAPNVQGAAHALGDQETRTYLKPTVLAASSNVSQLIFPGVQQDVGGHKDNAQPTNKNIMTLARSWIVEEARKVNVAYLDTCMISKIDQQTILINPVYIQPGLMAFPDGVFNKRVPPAYQGKDIEDAIDIEKALDDPLLGGPREAFLEPFKKRPYVLFEDRVFPDNISRFVQKAKPTTLMGTR